MAKTFDTHPLEVIQRMKALNVTEVGVWFSCGKDALATLDLCFANFSRVVPAFMYFIPGLSFQEQALTYCERRYSCKIDRIPSSGLTDALRDGFMRSDRTDDIKRLKHRDYDAWFRAKHNIEWIASGEKCIDSVERNAMIKVAKGIDTKRKRFWPVGYWSHRAIYSYLTSRAIPLPPDYRFKLEGQQSRSFSFTWPAEQVWLRDNFPDDYKKLCKLFPQVPAYCMQYEASQARKKKEAETLSNAPHK